MNQLKSSIHNFFVIDKYKFELHKITFINKVI